MGMWEMSDEREPRLRRAKAEFGSLLLKLLPECARGRSGLFGQHARAVGQDVAARYYAWPEADTLFALSQEIVELQKALGDTTEFPLLKAYLAYRAETGSNLPSEPKLAL